MSAIRQRTSRPKVRRPAFKPKFHVEIVPGEGVFILSENYSFLWEGEHSLKVIPLINGQRSVEDIVTELREDVARKNIYETLDRLLQAGQIEEADSSMPHELGVFWSEMNVELKSLRRQLGRVSVRIEAFDGIDSRPLANWIESFGIRVTKRGRFVVALVNDYLNPELERLNAQCMALGNAWMLLRPNGVTLWLGPVFVPGRTACWHCLAHRLRYNREVESYLQKKKGLTQPLSTSQVGIPLTQTFAYVLAAVQIARWIVSGSNPALESNLVVADPIKLRLDSHQVVRRPQCPVCGASDGEVVRCESRFLNADSHASAYDGGSREESPEVTFERYRHHISSITGVVRGLYPSILHSSSPVRVYSAGHNLALRGDSLHFLKAGLRTFSAGKGKSDIQAKTSALCEALERYSGVFQGDEERITASYREIRDKAIHPNACMLFSDKQYQEREAWLAKGSLFLAVPQKLNEIAKIEWSPVYSHSEKRKKYLPTSYLYYGYPVPVGALYCGADSNGNAAGVTFHEACLQAVLELIERDSVALWWYNQIRRPQVDLATFNDPYFQVVQEYYAGIGREIWVLDLASDTQIPSFAAISRRCHGDTEDIIMGFGAHLDAHIGVSRAITEMNQYLTAVHCVGADGKTSYASDDPDILHWWKTANITNCGYLWPLDGVPARLADGYPTASSNSIRDKVLQCFQRIEGLGLEVLLLDQTRPDIGLPVVKVIVPGLRHFWTRFAPGRLYDVPVKLGWLREPKTEATLNSIPMWF
jgi:bacteriocin biosynthesis cyclodehydratase domain-containing protein